ncbi:MAG: dimethylsulfoniopropionate demethylase [Kiloniellales bacterium]|nr:dimethylsulfoniopropionate demethylase [Kiloniellales bacterium]
MAEETAAAIAIGPRIRKSPFYDATRRQGCKAFTIYNHMYLPVYYESPEADYRRLIEAVTLWDVGVERQVEITGPDAARFTQFLTPRNLSTCAVGQCKYVLLTTERGGIVNDPVLLRLAEDRFWLSLADSDVLLWARALAHALGYDVEVREPDVSPLQVQGPRSLEVMRDLFGGWIEELRYFWFRETELDGIPLVVSRTGWSAERGYEVFLRDGRHGDRLWETIMEAGQPYGIGPGAPSTIRRIEGGLLSYGADMDLDTNPYELGLGRLVDLDQEADFMGKAALAEIAQNGVARRLVGLEIEGPRLPTSEEPWAVAAGERGIGKVTSAAHSPRLGKNIALAMLAAEAINPGSAVEVSTPLGRRAAEVVELPFFDPKKRLPSQS